MSLKASSLFATVMAVGLSVGAYAQEPADLFKIDLPQEVVVGDKILPVGLWDIRWPDNDDNPTIKFYRNNAINVEVPVVASPSENNMKHEATEGVIQKIGRDYYLTKIWIKGQRTDYAIRLPSQTALLQRGDSRAIPATFISGYRFSKGAYSEGDNRTHAAMGLGGPDDRSFTGVAIARNFREGDTRLAQDRVIAGEAPVNTSAADTERARAALQALTDARLEQERAMAAQREAAANAAAADAANRTRAMERAEADRGRLDRESAIQRTADDTKAQTERTRLDAEHMNQRAADDARSQAERVRLDTASANQRAARDREATEAANQLARRVAAEQAEREQRELRRKLATQLNTILETKDTDRGLIVSMSNVLFDTGKYGLSTGAQDKLTKLAAVVLAYPSLVLGVEGHTDSVGTDKDNQLLSENRATSVRDFLVGRGIGSSFIGSRGFGENQPVATNDTATGRQQNRRVELVVSGGAIGASGTGVIVGQAQK